MTRCLRCDTAASHVKYHQDALATLRRLKALGENLVTEDFHYKNVVHHLTYLEQWQALGRDCREASHPPVMGGAGRESLKRDLKQRRLPLETK